jgi:hypothetical protein
LDLAVYNIGTFLLEGSNDNYCKSGRDIHTIVTAILGLRLTSERKCSKVCEDLGWFLVWVHAIAES